MKEKDKVLSFILLFLLIGCVNTPLSNTIPASDRDKIIKSYLDKSGDDVVKISHLDERKKGPPLEVDIIYARHLKNQGWGVEDYKMEFEDVLDISVWEVEKLQRTVVVRPDGKISFPLVGDIQAEGVTITELRKDLTKKLSRYIRNPQVSVSIKKFGGKRATVMREIGGGKVLRFTAPIQVLEAVAMSGGYSTNLNLKKIYVVRQPKTTEEKTKIIVVDAQNLLRNGDIRENIYIQSKDIVFLARGAYASVKYFKEELRQILEAEYRWHPAASTSRHTGPIIRPQIGDENN